MWCEQEKEPRLPGLSNTYSLKINVGHKACCLWCPQEKEPRLPGLLKMLLWAQGQLDEKVVYPHIDLATGRLSEVSPSCAPRGVPGEVSAPERQRIRRELASS